MPYFNSIISICLFSHLIFTELHSQEWLGENSQKIELSIERLFENTEQDIDISDLIDLLDNFHRNPLRINNSDKKELERFPLFNDIQINNLVHYLKKYGTILTVYELAYIDGFSPDFVKSIVPFISLKFNMGSNKIKNLKYHKHQLLLKTQRVLQKEKGYNIIADSILLGNPTKGRYLGDRNKYYLRYSSIYSNFLQLGIVAEKDAGELFIREDKGFDFYSAYLQYSGKAFLKSINLGDYHTNFGQGLNIWSSIAMRKSSDVLNIRKKLTGVKKSSSTDENNYLRGGAITLNLSDIDFTYFYSLKKIDASMDEDIVSLQNSGFHRTPTELASKHFLQEAIVGGNISLNRRWFKVGSTFTKYNYDSKINPKYASYNTFYFRGDKNFVISMDYNLAFSTFYVFGEIARSRSNAFAYITGVTSQLSSQVSLSVLIRSYEKEYQSLYANSFGESSQTQNEKGIYTALVVEPFKQWVFSCYWDVFEFPWISFNASAPSIGQDFYTKIDFTADRNTKMYWSLKIETKEKDFNEAQLPILKNECKKNIRFHIEYKVSEEWILKNRVEIANYQFTSNEYGFLLYQDVMFKPKNIPLHSSLRVALFNTESYNSRLYAYENDILYSFSVPAYYSKGTRIYFNLKYKLRKNINLWFRWAETYYSDRDVLGSSLSEIDGNRKSDVKFQLQVKF